MKALVQRILRGDVLSGKYAVIHLAVRAVAERRYGKKYGSVLNVETNILLTAVLLRYYLNYPWKHKSKRLHFQPSVRAILAIAAYNQGEATVLKWLRQLRKAHPDFDLELNGLEGYHPFFTRKSLKKILKNSTARSREAFLHVWNITNCSEKPLDERMKLGKSTQTGEIHHRNLAEHS